MSESNARETRVFAGQPGIPSDTALPCQEKLLTPYRTTGFRLGSDKGCDAVTHHRASCEGNRG